MENELVAVDVNTFWIFDISKDGETKNDLLIRANNYRKREIKDQAVQSLELYCHFTF